MKDKICNPRMHTAEKLLTAECKSNLFSDLDLALAVEKFWYEISFTDRLNSFLFSLFIIVLKILIEVYFIQHENGIRFF
mgnify:FL=1|jgi:hypothetical protein